MGDEAVDLIAVERGVAQDIARELHACADDHQQRGTPVSVLAPEGIGELTLLVALQM